MDTALKIESLQEELDEQADHTPLTRSEIRKEIRRMKKLLRQHPRLRIPGRKKQ